MTAWDKLEAFHAHLDGCAQCRDHPFQLCPEGQDRLVAFAKERALEPDDLRERAEAIKERSRKQLEALLGPAHDAPADDLSLPRTPERGTEANGAQIDHDRPRN